MPAELLAKLRAYAQRRQLPYQTCLQTLLAESLSREEAR
jgi:hypothetical protein